jgi:NADH-quinone oxidoreductase subunit H
VWSWGLFQSFADLLKFVFKEFVIPDGANKGVFVIAPLVTSVLAISAWAVVPVADGWAIADINVGILYLFALSSLGVYGIIMGGWASNSKYPFLAALRSAAQMVSYEVSIGFVIITLLCAGSLNLSKSSSPEDRARPMQPANSFDCISFRCSMFILFPCQLAETRPPAGLVGAESNWSRLHGGIFVDHHLLSCSANMWRSR